ncbi:hypothetical protein KY290_019708 [Solanum tuberosum]|uniref:Integrase catalytic domain-containing protein n=1 Tax=Solanum tuberosum TaxID=4113 RepID=A0ABQ7VHT4_SOLTU|nr:hypothetical protein KY290_019708 [Solanum tuberosum]
MERTIKYFRTNNVLEFCSEELNDFCKIYRITRHKTVKHTSQQNGVAKRMNKTFLEKVRYILLQAKMFKVFWAKEFTLLLILSIDLQDQRLTLRLRMRHVSRDVAFDESSILDPRKFFMELSENENNEQVELSVELTKERDQESQVNESKDANLEEFVVKEPYTIVKEWENIDTKTESLTEQANLISYAFVEENIKDLEPFLYIEATSC